MARRDEKPSHQRMRRSYQSQNPKISHERGCLVLLHLQTSLLAERGRVSPFKGCSPAGFNCYVTGHLPKNTSKCVPQVIVPQRVEAAKLADEDVINIKCLATPTRLRCQTNGPSISQRYGITKSTLVENEAVSLKGNHRAREPRRGSTLLTGFDTLPLSIRECTLHAVYAVCCPLQPFPLLVFLSWGEL